MNKERELAEKRDEENLFDPDSEEIEVIYDAPEDEEEVAVSDVEGETGAPAEKVPEAEKGTEADQLRELNDKYVRLYAEFENYRKRVVKDKEDIVKYANESILYELLPSLDHLEIALKHANDTSKGIVEGVEMTLRELYRTLEKFGLKRIEAEGQPFDPKYHHAVSQVERDDMKENMVVEEMRQGFIYGEKLLRASMVSVSVKSAAQAEEKSEETDEQSE
jgi:molecular chaperone GrpE